MIVYLALNYYHESVDLSPTFFHIFEVLEEKQYKGFVWNKIITHGYSLDDHFRERIFMLLHKIKDLGFFIVASQLNSRIALRLVGEKNRIDSKILHIEPEDYSQELKVSGLPFCLLKEE